MADFKATFTEEAAEFKSSFDNNISNDDILTIIASIKNEFANALKGYTSGYLIELSDLSPVSHNINAKIITDAKNYNLLPYPYPINVFKNDGITVTMNDEDKSITINGTPTRAIGLQIFKGEMYLKGKYTLGGVDNSDGDLTPGIQPVIDGVWKNVVRNEPLEYELDGTLTDVKLFLSKGYTYKNEVVKPYLIKSDKLNIDINEVKILSYGASKEDNYREYTLSEEGTAKLSSLYPVTTITTNKGDLSIECEYNKDINKAIAEIYKTINQLAEKSAEI